MKNFKKNKAEKTQTLRATVDKNPKGFAFLMFDQKDSEDVFVPPRQASRLFPGDRVEVVLKGSEELSSKKKRQILSIEVLEHRFHELVGRYHVHPRKKNQGWVVYEKKKTSFDIYIPHVTLAVRDGDWVKIQVRYERSEMLGKIIQVYGAKLPASADVDYVSAEFQLTEKHSEAAVREAQSFSQADLEKEIKNRVDLRHIPFITIDGETARDFDDAISVEKRGEDYLLWVAIADVSHYVQEGTSLDDEAFARGTSVYFPERAFHMLPAELSENLCSLKPHQSRLALVAKMLFSNEGISKHVELFEAGIKSIRRATYNEIQKEKESHTGKAAWSSWSLKPSFELFEILKKARQQRGTIDFDFPEPEIRVDSNTGEVLSIQIRDRLETHRLIEEFMIAANESVTQWAMKQKTPFLYRIHQEPSPLSIEKFQDLLQSMGISLKIKNAQHPAEISDVVKKLSEHPAAPVLNQTLLRSMKQAVYSSTHDIHYGLASEGYTHFTSPIRRYPDLVVHRLLRNLLKKKQKKSVQSLTAQLGEVAEQCNYRERLATEAEREIMKIKQVRFLSRHLGEEFNGIIVGMVSSGFFVQLKDPYAEGLVPVDSLPGGGYEFDAERMLFVGRQKTYRLGDWVRVQVARTDLDRFQIDFILSGSELGKGSSSQPRKKVK